MSDSTHEPCSNCGDSAFGIIGEGPHPCRRAGCIGVHDERTWEPHPTLPDYGRFNGELSWREHPAVLARLGPARKTADREAAAQGDPPYTLMVDGKQFGEPLRASSPAEAYAEGMERIFGFLKNPAPERGTAGDRLVLSVTLRPETEHASAEWMVDTHGSSVEEVTDALVAAFQQHLNRQIKTKMA